jgi:trk system potassium uptake protein TrkA
MSIRVLVVGGGRVGTALATLLRDSGNTVTIFDEHPSVLARLRDAFGSEHVRAGGFTNPGALEAAGARAVDVVAATTADDACNLVITCLARFHFGVPRTVARIVDPARAWMYCPEMGVDAALNQADLIAHVVAEEMSLGEMTTLLKLRRGKYALVEERVHPSSPAAGRPLGELTVPDECVIVAVLRAGAPILHDPTVTLEPDDEVLAVVHVDSAAELADLLAPSSSHARNLDGAV